MDVVAPLLKKVKRMSKSGQGGRISLYLCPDRQRSLHTDREKYGTY